jgi:hypothetical protein
MLRQKHHVREWSTLLRHLAINLFRSTGPRSCSSLSQSTKRAITLIAARLGRRYSASAFRELWLSRRSACEPTTSAPRTASRSVHDRKVMAGTRGLLAVSRQQCLVGAVGLARRGACPHRAADRGRGDEHPGCRQDGISGLNAAPAVPVGAQRQFARRRCGRASRLPAEPRHGAQHPDRRPRSACATRQQRGRRAVDFRPRRGCR